MLKLLWPGLLCTLGEKVLNPLISMDPDALMRLQRLQGKQLAVCLRGIDIRLVLTAQPNGIWLNSHQEVVDCAVETEFSALQQLSDPSQLTRLIRENKLQIDGDLQTLQQFSQFFQQLNPDWQERLSVYLGDAAAHKVAGGIQGANRVRNIVVFGDWVEGVLRVFYSAEPYAVAINLIAGDGDIVSRRDPRK